jgi:hypothetical protein
VTSNSNGTKRGELGSEPLCVGPAAHAAEDAEPVVDEDFCGTPADARGRSRYHDAAHSDFLALME